MIQIANILLSVGGDGGNQVPKFGVTAAEIPVLQGIHGEDAVTEIEITGEVDRTNRDEFRRLRETYSRIQDGKDVSPVASLYPGAAARVFERFDELPIPEEFYKAERRKTPSGVSAAKPKYEHVEVKETIAVSAADALVMTIESLDPDNDEHWTKTGLPTMSVIEETCGKSVSRVDVEKAAPGYTREVAAEKRAKALDTLQVEEASVPLNTDETTDVVEDAGEPDGIEEMPDKHLFA